MCATVVCAYVCICECADVFTLAICVFGVCSRYRKHRSPVKRFIKRSKSR